jgi:hypothetical protein
VGTRQPGLGARAIVWLGFVVVAASCGSPAPSPSLASIATNALPSAISSEDPTPVAGVAGQPVLLAKPWLPPWAGPATPPEIGERPNLRFCGVEVGPAAADPAVRSCFRNAIAAGLDVEFARIETTTEGDPIATVYEFDPPSSFQQLVDSTQDAFGAKAWTVVICRQIVNDPVTQFHFDGCSEGPRFR